MSDEDTTTELLREIRDLLVIVAGANRSEYEKVVRQELGAQATVLQETIGSVRRWEAVLLMDGSRSQAEVVRDARIDAGAVSRLVKRLRELGFATVEDRRPRMRLTTAELEAVRNA